MLTAAPSLFDSFTALSDATRCRLLGLIEHHELTVSELCAVLQLPQSTVSRHLKLLADAGWVSSRRDGTSRYYALALDGTGGPRSQIWDLTKPQVAARVGAAQDSRRLARVLAGRGEASQPACCLSNSNVQHRRSTRATRVAGLPSEASSVSENWEDLRR